MHKHPLSYLNSFPSSCSSHFSSYSTLFLSDSPSHRALLASTLLGNSRDPHTRSIQQTTTLSEITIVFRRNNNNRSQKCLSPPNRWSTSPSPYVSSSSSLHPQPHNTREKAFQKPTLTLFVSPPVAMLRIRAKGMSCQNETSTTHHHHSSPRTKRGWQPKPLCLSPNPSKEQDNI